MARAVRVRTDLPFIAHDAAGNRMEWHPPRHAVNSHVEALRSGAECAAALRALAEHDEFEAYEALKEALLSRAWNGYLGEEEGFADAVARAVVIGWRAMGVAEEVPFGTEFEPREAEVASLRRRVEALGRGS